MGLQSNLNLSVFCAKCRCSMIHEKATGRKDYNEIWKAICLGIQACLFDKPVDIPLCVEWENVFIESKKQTITGIVRRGVKDSISQEIDTEWEQFDFLNLLAFIKTIDEQARLTDLLKGADIPFVILKGTAAAIYYPYPELRYLGDIDFYVQPEWFNKARELLIKNNYVFNQDDDRHLILFKSGIRYEMHHRFSNEPTSIYVDECIEACMGGLHTGTIRNRSFPILPPLENGLVLLVHLRQHMVAGIGLRQIIDSMMYVNSVLNDEYWKSTFEQHALILGLRKLAISVTRMCQLYLGLSDKIKWCASADEQLCNRLMENIIQSGNFGSNHDKGTIIEKTFTIFKKKGLFNYLQEAGEYNWKVYHRCHFLKPFAWIYQIHRYLKQGIDTKRSFLQLMDDYRRSRERHKLLKDLGCL